jgi:4-amino-4-deoxy-L-arabinose transferase-like glycosyltransferase
MEARAGSTAVLMTIAVVVLGLLVANQLGNSRARIAGTSGAAPRVFVAEIPQRGGTLCQEEANLLKGAGELRLLLGTYGRPGPRLDVTFKNTAGRTLVTSRLPAGWGEGPVVIPVPSPPADIQNGTACITSAGGARIAVAGEPNGTPAVVNMRAQSGRASIDAFTARAKSTFSLLPELGSRLGRGSAELIGPWTVVFIGLLLIGALASSGLAVVLALRGDLTRGDSAGDIGSRVVALETSPIKRRAWLRAQARRVPQAGYAIAVAAFAVTLAWSLLTPPFQVPDETSHIAYVQYLAETGDLPTEVAGTAAFAPEENDLLGALGFARVIGRPTEKVLTTAASEKYLRTVEGKLGAPTGNGNVANASSNPPLYYLLQAPVYLATSSSSLLTQIVAMRLLSVLFTTLTVLLAYLFLRELMPGSPGTWVLGGLACAFQPILGFIGSGVTPDSLLFLCGTGLLLYSARILRRGLTMRRAVVLALFALAGLLTKPVFMALLPAACLAVLFAWRKQGRAATRPALTAAALVLAPMVVYTVAASVALDHPYFGVASDVASTSAGGGAGGTSTSPMRALSFVFQLFVARPPFLTDLVPGFPLKDLWVTGFVGVFGWLDYGFARPQVDFAMRLLVITGLLGLVALFRPRRSVRQHLPLTLVLLTALAGVLAAVGLTDYQASITNAPRFEQARYLLPLIALYGGLFALAGKGLGSRLVRLILPALWVLVSLHTVAAVILTTDRFYL